MPAGPARWAGADWRSFIWGFGLAPIPFPPGTTQLDIRYRVEITDLDEVPLADITEEITGLAFSRILNGSGSCAFEIAKHNPVATMDLFAEGERKVLIYRQNILVWNGFLDAFNVDDSSVTVKFAANDRWSRFGSPGRYIDADLTYDDVDQYDIAWDLIDRAQTKTAGDVGLVRNPSETASGVLRTVAYVASERPVVAEAISSLAAALDGFDFEVTPAGLWKVYDPTKALDSGAVFELGKNVAGYAYVGDATTIVTDLTVTGGPLAVSAASFSSGHLHFTAKGHGFSVGQKVSTTGFTPDGYSVSGQKITAVTANTFDVAESTDPGGVTVLGTVSRDSGPGNISSVAADAVARARYGRREQALSFSDVSNHAQLDGIAAAQIAALASPSEQPTIGVLTSDPDAALEAFDSGSLVRIRIDDGFLQINDVFRAVSLAITLIPAGQEQVSVGFDKRTGVRWVPVVDPVDRIFDLHRRVGILERR